MSDYLFYRDLSRVLKGRLGHIVDVQFDENFEISGELKALTPSLIHVKEVNGDYIVPLTLVTLVKVNKWCKDNCQLIIQKDEDNED